MQNIYKHYPLVTFVSPCYNHQKYVIESLQSIRDQTYPNIQHIIIDDASTDSSSYLIRKWIEDNNYKCQYIRHTQNQGISSTLNESIKLAKGEFWTALATDDFALPNRTQRFVEYLCKNHCVNMVVSDSKMMNEHGTEIEINGTSSFIEYYVKFNPMFKMEDFGTFNNLLYGNYIPSSVMIRTRIFDEVGFFSEHLKIEDWDMWLRVSQKSQINLINEQLTFYRWHLSNSVNNKDNKTLLRKNVLRIILGQKEFCYRNNKRKLFEDVYKFYFRNFFSPKHLSVIVELFKGISPLLVFKGLTYKFLSIRKRSQ